MDRKGDVVVTQRTLTCDLCEDRIGRYPVVRTFDAEEKHFCCEGCARVYELAYENDMLDQVLPSRKPERLPGPMDLPKLFLDPGKSVGFALDGMWCAGCAQAAERILEKHPGIKEANVNFAAERGRIRYDPELVDPEEVLHSLDGLGYRARVLGDPSARREVRHQERLVLQLIAAAAFGNQIMMLYLTQLYPLYARHQFDAPNVRNLQYLVWALATPVMFVGGLSFLKGAWRALRAGTATMDTLVALGTLSAYSYSVYITLAGGGEAYFDSVAMITTFVMLGRYLERIGSAQARKDVRHLLELQPELAWQRIGGEWKQVKAGVLVPGDEILVKPGERVPADATIQEGEAAVEEALLTGESSPVNKGPSDTIYAGTIVTDNAVTGQVTRAVQETRLAQITRIVEETLSNRPPIQRLADTASRYFAIGIVSAAALTFLGWWITGAPASTALLTAVAVLVVACPCALGLATPLALAIVLGRTSQAGILVRNPAALETAATVKRIVLDKTGTLTLGKLKVVEVLASPSSEMSSQELLCVAAGVEQFSEHPVAKAIVDACSHPPAHAEAFKALRGLGVSAAVEALDNTRVMVGSSELLKMDGSSALSQEADARAREGETIVWVGWEDTVAGLIALRDEPNPTARDALAQLAGAGIQAVMLSGDSLQTTRAIAAELGIGEHKGRMSPVEKAERIRQWQGVGERVAMAGDGVNDAPALARADLSITTASGTDVAGETSDLVLTHSDLTLIPQAIRLARRTRRIIRQNLGWAFAYNVIAVPLAALGIISPAIAAATMAVSSLLVVSNSLRLRL
jgi:heavy metal translocating P-type ATPase